MTNVRNSPLQQLERLRSDRARLVTETLALDAPFSRLEAASKALGELTEKAMTGDAASYTEYQQLLYILSLSDDPATARTRRWLAHTIYQVEERFIVQADVPERLSEADFQARLEREVTSHSREKHPMSQYVFGDSATRSQLQVFLRHQWFRTFRLYRDATDLSVSLMNVDEAAALGRYLYGELGEEDEKRSHPRLLAKLLNAMDLEADFQAISTMPEEIAYLNNRARCFRHPDVGWGLAVFYVTEMVVPGNHKKLYQALVKAGLSEDAAEYYKVHISLVPPRAKREWQLIASRIPDPAFQKSFLTSLMHHFRIEKLYYDAVWEQMRHTK